MIAHISIPAKDPRATALFLASLIDGEVFAFPVIEGAWITVARNGSGMAIEVYPDGMAHHPGQGAADPQAAITGPQTMPWEDQIYTDGVQLRPSAFHFAIASSLKEEQVQQLALANGLRSVRCERAGIFTVIEVWIDNVFLVEVLCGNELSRYTDFMKPNAIARMFGPGLLPATQTSFVSVDSQP